MCAKELISEIYCKVHILTIHLTVFVCCRRKHSRHLFRMLFFFLRNVFCANYILYACMHVRTVRTYSM